MLSALYVAITALLILKLAYDVIKLRTQYGVWHGDGGFYELQIALRIYRYAVEYMPIACLLMLMMEMNGAVNWMLHVSGISLIAGRLMHAYGLKQHDFYFRKLGMTLTFSSLLIMIIFNLYYLPWDMLYPSEYTN
ncbi:MAPEG family protein [Thorsellia anophelis]|uniref:MAPEG family protein n=1 Tax=Thorsellia anophelis DSM 18579 TaxID=1123402 RepID=A0A1I0DHD8_9GAMM|nr:MAPEG family protein [Thorsellia anophelis]SET31781.1 hypothetical protein SAMN02583745_01992 [Thorsellia anophelis DSM 18579]